MPLVYTQAIWEALYAGMDVDGVYKNGYTRSRLWRPENYQWMRRRIDMVGGGQLNNASVLHVGCAFGWLMELALDEYGADSWGIDSSPHVAANLATEARADIIPRILTGYTLGVDASNTIKSALQAIGGSRTYTYVLDEDAASSHTDAELPAFISACEDMLQGNAKGRIIHLVTPQIPGATQDSSINWKLMSDWKAVAPDHRWFNIITGEEQL